MPIAHMIIHRLVRNADSEASVSLSASEIRPEHVHDQLFQQLRGNFLGRVSRQHGSFGEDEKSPCLKMVVSAMLAEEISFVQLSETLMQQLKQAVEELELVLDCHFVFLVERSANQHIFYLFLVGLNEALTINDQLAVTSCFTVDTGAALCGIKLDIEEWQANSQYAYLTMVPPRNNPLLTELLESIAGFGHCVNKEESTLNFLEGIESYVQHVPEEKVDEYRAQVVNYCMEQDERDQPVSISELSQSLEGVEEAHFSQAMSQYQPQGKEDILIDRRSMRRYVKFFGRDKDLSVSFSTFHLNKRVHYDIENDVLTIEGVPRSLRNQLHKHSSVQ